MRYVAAYMLAVMGGNPDPSAEDLINILASVGVEVDLENLNRVIKELKGKDLEEVAEKGKLYTSWTFTYIFTALKIIRIYLCFG